MGGQVLFWRKKKMDLTLFFATDVHGSERCFMKFVNAARFYSAGALILGGDVTGKGLVPLVEQHAGVYTMQFLGKARTAQTEAEAADLEKQVRVNGFYPYRCAPDELARMEADSAYAQAVFQRVMRQSVERWVAIADERLKAAGIPVFMMPGNDDEEFVGEALSSGRWVQNADGRVLEVGPYQLLSSGYANPTPWHTHRELPEDQLLTKLGDLVRQLNPSRPAIFNLHPPPHRSNLDMAPQLTEDLTVVSDSGQPKLVPVGSTAVRSVIAEAQPVLSLHGHVHESRAVARIGRTVCINPGSEYNSGVLRGALVKLGQSEVVAHQLVSG